jgi:hypothetical protein
MAQKDQPAYHAHRNSFLLRLVSAQFAIFVRSARRVISILKPPNKYQEDW